MASPKSQAVAQQFLDKLQSSLVAGQRPSAAAYLHVIILRGAGIICRENGPGKGALVQLFIKEGDSKGPVFHSKPMPSQPPVPQQVGCSFVWDSKFVIPLQAVTEQTRLVCTIWHVEIVQDTAAGTVTSKAGVLVGKVVINVHKLLARANQDVLQAFTIAGDGDLGQVLPTRYLSTALRLELPDKPAP